MAKQLVVIKAIIRYLQVKSSIILICYLFLIGLGWFKRTYVKAASFELTMNIENDDETLTVSGKSK